MSFSIIIPSRDAANLVACVDQIRLFEGYGCRIIVVDDGLNLTEANNRSGVGCYFCDSGDCLKIPGVKPFIFARNVNLGIKAAGADDVILLNDDALLQSKSGFTWLSGKTQTGEYDIVSATTNLAGNPAQQRARGYDGIRFHSATLVRDEPRTVAFVCVFIPRRTIDAVGLLDERFTAYGWEDNDYCRRVRMAGGKIGIYDGCYVDHGSLRSTFRGNPYAPGDIAAGAHIYMSKWGDLN